MKRKYNLRRIKAKRSYTSEELAETLQIHTQTVREWKRNGLKPLEEATTPHLFIGCEVKKFLSELISRHKVELREGEFYCLSCKKAVKPVGFEVVNRGIKIGKSKESLMLTGKCPHCSRVVNRFSSNLKTQRRKKSAVVEEKVKGIESADNPISLFEGIEN